MADMFKVVEGSYFRDLLSQPAAISDTVTSLRRTGRRHTNVKRFEKIVLTGMGSSMHALHPLQNRLISAGFTAIMVETSELLYAQAGLLTGRTLLVTVSQSGRSAETVLLLDKISGVKDKPVMISVTNAPGSPLALRSDEVVLLHAGEESTVSCKTYVATLAALEWLGGTMSGEDPDKILDEMEAASQAARVYLQRSHEHVRQLMGSLTGLKHLFLVGRGVSLASVGTGALILKESTRFHAEGMSSAAFRHGPLEMVNPGVLVVVFKGTAATAPLNERLVRDVRSGNGHAVVVGEDAEGVFSPQVPSERARPIMEILPVQMLSLALAARAGIEAGIFERATKITITE